MLVLLKPLPLPTSSLSILNAIALVLITKSSLVLSPLHRTRIYAYIQSLSPESPGSQRLFK